jgi:hypothetical protein
VVLFPCPDAAESVHVKEVVADDVGVGFFAFFSCGGYYGRHIILSVEKNIDGAIAVWKQVLITALLLGVMSARRDEIRNKDGVERVAAVPLLKS